MVHALVRPRSVLLLLVALLVAAGIAGIAWRGADRMAQRASNGEACLAAATAAAQAIFSYDYRSYDASVANGASFTTGAFTGQYQQTTANLKPVAVQQQAVVRAEVSGAGIVEAQLDRVELLVYVNQYRRNVAVDGEKVDQNRVVLSMIPADGGCKVVDATAI